jgi:hypothetical protein
MKSAVKIKITNLEKAKLEKIITSKKTPVRLIERSKIVLYVKMFTNTYDNI